MKNFVWLFAPIVFSACSRQPQPIHYGMEECSECKMIIMDKKFGAEIISTKGKIYKFDDLICLIEFLSNKTIAENEISRKLVINYQQENSFLAVEKATYYVSDNLHSPMNGNAAAFSDKEVAQKSQTGKQGDFMDWNEVYNKLK